MRNHLSTGVNRKEVKMMGGPVAGFQNRWNSTSKRRMISLRNMTRVSFHLFLITFALNLNAQLTSGAPQENTKQLSAVEESDSGDLSHGKFLSPDDILEQKHTIENYPFESSPAEVSNDGESYFPPNPQEEGGVVVVPDRDVSETDNASKNNADEELDEYESG